MDGRRKPSIILRKALNKISDWEKVLNVQPGMGIKSEANLKIQ